MYKLYNRLYEERPQAYSSAPGRIDFLNTHQDYKGLPVVSVAVNLRTHILAGQRSDELVIAYSTNIGLDKPERYHGEGIKTQYDMLGILHIVEEEI